MTKPATYEFDAPVAWAQALINGDESGLDGQEWLRFVRWFRANNEPHVIDCAVQSRFGIFQGSLTDIVTYTAYVPVPAKRLT